MISKTVKFSDILMQLGSAKRVKDLAALIGLDEFKVPYHIPGIAFEESKIITVKVPQDSIKEVSCLKFWRPDKTFSHFQALWRYNGIESVNGISLQDLEYSYNGRFSTVTAREGICIKGDSGAYPSHTLCALDLVLKAPELLVSSYG